MAELIGVNVADMTPKSEAWMHPLDALAVVVTLESATPQLPDDVKDALRTHAGLSRHDRARWVAAAMGTGIATARKYDSTRLDGTRGRNCLYRFWDSAGVLLYVGIAKNPDAREAAHAKGSRWYAYACRREDEWYPDRQAASAAERKAIRAEGPVFNILGSRVDPDEAEEYLMWRSMEMPERL